MGRIKLTSKRQATFPARVCEELGVDAGDELDLVRCTLGEDLVWIVKPARPNLEWVGSLRAAATGKDHSVRAIRRSIRKGWGLETRAGHDGGDPPARRRTGDAGGSGGPTTPRGARGGGRGGRQ